MSNPPLAPLELRGALLDEGASTFAHIFGGATEAEEGGFEEEALFLGHLHAVLDGFHGVLYSERSVGNDFLGD